MKTVIFWVWTLPELREKIGKKIRKSHSLSSDLENIIIDLENPYRILLLEGGRLSKSVLTSTSLRRNNLIRKDIDCESIFKK